MKILVTGASGMLGGVLSKRLSARYQVVGVSRTGGNKTFACDLARPDEVEKLFKNNVFLLVIHAAAYSDVDGCERDPNRAHEANAISTRNLARVCQEEKVPFLYVSTDYVFDGRKKRAYTEKDITAPVNIYGLTKLEGEYHARQWRWVTAVVRTSWLFGAANPANFVNAMIERLKKEKSVGVLADQEDSPTSVEDLSEALERIGEHLMKVAAESPKDPYFDIFQVCNAGSTTRFEMAEKIRDFLGSEAEVVRIDPGRIQNRLAVRPARPVMSARHYETFFKVKLRPWEQSLKAYLESAAR